MSSGLTCHGSIQRMGHPERGPPQVYDDGDPKAKAQSSSSKKERFAEENESMTVSEMEKDDVFDRER